MWAADGSDAMAEGAAARFARERLAIPVLISELRARLECAGLREVDTDFDASADRYAVVTVTT